MRSLLLPLLVLWAPRLPGTLAEVSAWLPSPRFGSQLLARSSLPEGLPRRGTRGCGCLSLAVQLRHISGVRRPERRFPRCPSPLGPWATAGTAACPCCRGCAAPPVVPALLFAGIPSRFPLLCQKLRGRWGAGTSLPAKPRLKNARKMLVLLWLVAGQGVGRRHFL